MDGLLALALVSLAALPRQEPSLELRVERAIARGIAWLRTRQSPDGSWPGFEEKHPGGATALACFALVKSGVSADDPNLLAGLRSIASVRFESTYSASVALLLFAALRDVRAPGGTPRLEEALGDADPRACFDLLVATQKDGLWGYPWDPIDMSNTQFALLGLRAGSQLGYEIPERILARSAEALLKQQEDSGGFGYRPGLAERGGMSAAVLAGIAVITELAKGKSEIVGPFAKHRDRLRAAETWMETRFDAERQPFASNAWTPDFHYEYLWAIERWCGLTGKAKVGAKDWYKEGASFLEDEQGHDGDWNRSLEDTCFALLFLRRATITGWEDRSAVNARLDEAKARAEEKPRVALDPAVPRLTSVLVAGPFRDEKGNPRFGKLDLASLRPREKEKFQERSFDRVALKPDGWTDLEAATGRGGNFVDWIVATNLTWKPPPGEKEPVDGILWFALEDAWKIWLDGKLVSSEMRMAAPIVENVQVPIALGPGEHALVVLVADHLGASAFSCRVTDRRGKAMPAGFSAAPR